MNRRDQDSAAMQRWVKVVGGDHGYTTEPLSVASLERMLVDVRGRGLPWVRVGELVTVKGRTCKVALVRDGCVVLEPIGPLVLSGEKNSKTETVTIDVERTEQ